MALGKYSPTVGTAYDIDHDWWDNYSVDGLYDPDGYDMYGYNKDNVDRAGNKESDYGARCQCCGQTKVRLYEDVEFEWHFDGVKPVRKTRDGEDWEPQQ
jgi:hypothetical protein